MAEPQVLSQRPTTTSTTTTTRLQAEISAFQGPLPPPETLARYSQIVPNGAERIMAMAESQLRHRQELESAVIHGNVNAQARAQWIAFVISMTVIISGIGLVAFDKPLSGLVTILGALASLVGVFVYGRQHQAKERDQKRQEVRDATMNPRLPFEKQT